MLFRWPTPGFILLALSGFLATSLAQAASIGKQINNLYEPFRVQQAAISPDGRRAAFVVANAQGIEIQLLDLDRSQPGPRFPLDPRASAEVRLLAWTSVDRVIAVSNSPIFVGIDAATGAAQTFGEGKGLPVELGLTAGRVVRPLALVNGDPDSVLVEVVIPSSDGATLEVHRFNTRTGQRTRSLERPLPDFVGTLILDQQGAPRLVFHRGNRTRRFDYRAAEAGASEWRNLDRVLDDRKTFSFAFTPETYGGPRTLPLGFDANPNLLYYASNIARDKLGLYAVDLRTGKRTDFALEDESVDLADLDEPWTRSPLVFDRANRKLVGVRITGPASSTRWFDAELTQVQSTLAEKFPDRAIQLLDWDAARSRFIVLINQPGEPGRYFVYHRQDGRCVEYFRRAPAIAAQDRNRTEPFAFTTTAGVRLSGAITLPHDPPVATPPLVVWLRDLWDRPTSENFDREAQALAAAGFAVMQLNYAGSPGSGHAQLEKLRRNLDRGPVADILASIEWLSTSHKFDRQHVSIVGEGFGGYVALRALQLQPAAFRSVVAINALVDLGDLNLRSVATPIDLDRLSGIGEIGQDSGGSAGSFGARIAGAGAGGATARSDFESNHRNWFVSAQSRLGDIAVTRRPELLTKPVLLAHNPAYRRAPIASVQALRDELIKRKLPVRYMEPAPGRPDDRASQLQYIAEFLNATAYDTPPRVGRIIERK